MSNTILGTIIYVFLHKDFVCLLRLNFVYILLIMMYVLFALIGNISFKTPIMLSTYNEKVLRKMNWTYIYKQIVPGSFVL